MPRWTGGMDGCDAGLDDVVWAIVHPANGHQRHECRVGGTIVPDGYFAIRHAFDEHTRAEFVRAYDADSAAVRRREGIKRDIEREADLQRVVDQMDRST
ncbi:DUF7565 family protein [Halorubrum lacusprofundi]|uniref:DUF7565 family protein n=1 Tax=Halorubrum lacusprofundi TaxID=2247 RepID=UPI000B5A8C0D|nr:hypothetical protein [Halorubrum lacusprofundi]